MGQNRVFYACQAVGVGAYGAEQYVEGVQSVGVNTTFDFEQAFELGVLTIYENIEGIPSVEVTMERNLVSGVHPLWYSVAAGGQLAIDNTTVSDSAASQVVAVGQARPSVVLQVYPDSTTFAGSVPADGASYVIRMSGMYLNNYSMNIAVDGPATESLTFTGNDYIWAKNGVQHITNAPAGGAVSSSGLVLKRQDVNSKTPSTLTYTTWLPTDSIISGSGLQSISVSIDFGREDILELGRKTPYHKSPTFPVEVSTEIEFVETNTVTKSYSSSDFTNTTSSDVTVSKPLGFTIGEIGVFMGSGNRLTGTSTTGGDAGGGNGTITFSYQTFNELAMKGSSAYKHYNKVNAGTAGTLR
jgi:hypothetical protein